MAPSDYQKWVKEAKGLSDEEMDDELQRPTSGPSGPTWDRIVEREALRRILEKLSKGPKMKLEKVKNKEGGPRMRLVFNADDFPDICEHCGGVHG